MRQLFDKLSSKEVFYRLYKDGVYWCGVCHINSPLLNNSDAVVLAYRQDSYTLCLKNGTYTFDKPEQRCCCCRYER